MKKLLTIVLAMVPIAAPAAEKFEATNTYVTETQAWPIDQATGYWMVTFEGVSQVTAGPIDTMGVECHGAGFWGADGLLGSGICVHGDGDDTFTLRFDAAPGGNTWKILTGTGKYQGISGEGTAATERLSGDRRISRLIGHVTIGD